MEKETFEQITAGMVESEDWPGRFEIFGSLYIGEHGPHTVVFKQITKGLMMWLEFLFVNESREALETLKTIIK